MDSGVCTKCTVSIKQFKHAALKIPRQCVYSYTFKFLYIRLIQKYLLFGVWMEKASYFIQIILCTLCLMVFG